MPDLAIAARAGSTAAQGGGSCSPVQAQNAHPEPRARVGAMRDRDGTTASLVRTGRSVMGSLLGPDRSGPGSQPTREVPH
jgi:hypothetical protein